MSLIADVFLNLPTPKNKGLKGAVSEDPSARNMVNGSKHC